MNRRQILRGLTTIPVALVPKWTCAYCDSISILSENCRNCGAAEHKSNSKEENDLVENYKGFKISWSGWHTFGESGKISGFYLAEGKETSFSSCTGGYADEYKLGYTLNTCVLADHKFLMFYSSEQDKKEEQKRALKTLIEIIDEHTNQTS